LSTEDSPARYTNLDLWSSQEVAEALLERQFIAVSAVHRALPELVAAAERAALRLREGGALSYAGAGTSGRIAAQDGAELPPTFGWPQERLRLLVAGGSGALVQAIEGAEDDRAAAREAAGQLGERDVLVSLSASGRTPFTAELTRAARARGALTIALANNPGSELLQLAELPIALDSGPEVIAGSTRLAAGTAQKVALNVFSTLVMVQLGRTYGNKMVALRAANQKLEVRAARIIAELSGADLETAAAMFGETRDVRVAVLRLKGYGPEEARRLASEQPLRELL
jgi:N-acetylmuramic acid 6-phosphate etherase